MELILVLVISVIAIAVGIVLAQNVLKLAKNTSDLNAQNMLLEDIVHYFY